MIEIETDIRDIERLERVTSLDTSKSIPVIEMVNVAHTRGGIILSEGLEPRVRGELNPRALQRLKRYAEFSLWTAFNRRGDVEQAERIIYVKR